MLLRFGVAVAAFFAPCLATACDAGAMRTNMRWVVSNNPTAKSRIEAGYQNVGRPGFDGAALQAIVDGYKFGQAHNAQAASAINGCSAIEIASAARDALGK